MKKAPYDLHYQQSDLFAEPLEELISFFQALVPRRTIWDLGAGQGRDALRLAQMGHRVFAFDISSVGLDQLRTKIPPHYQESVSCRQADIYRLPIEPSCEVILMDSMLHFYKRDYEKESTLVHRLSNELRPDGLLALAIVSNPRTKRALTDLKDGPWNAWSLLVDQQIVHKSSGARYEFLVLRKEDQ